MKNGRGLAMVMMMVVKQLVNGVLGCLLLPRHVVNQCHVLRV